MTYKLDYLKNIMNSEKVPHRKQIHILNLIDRKKYFEAMNIIENKKINSEIWCLSFVDHINSTTK